MEKLRYRIQGCLLWLIDALSKLKAGMIPSWKPIDLGIKPAEKTGPGFTTKFEHPKQLLYAIISDPRLISETLEKISPRINQKLSCQITLSGIDKNLTEVTQRAELLFLPKESKIQEPITDIEDASKLIKDSLQKTLSRFSRLELVHHLNSATDYRDTIVLCAAELKICYQGDFFLDKLFWPDERQGIDASYQSEGETLYRWANPA